MRMYPRSEFPTEVLPPIIRPNGRINRAAIGMRYSLVGCPHGNIDVVVAAIKSKVDVNVAFQLGMLAYYANTESTEPMKRTVDGMMHSAKQRHVAKHPRGFWAAAVEVLGAGATYRDERDPEVLAAWGAAVRAAYQRPVA
jgi:hypothetical protein